MSNSQKEWDDLTSLEKAGGCGMLVLIVCGLAFFVSSCFGPKRIGDDSGHISPSRLNGKVIEYERRSRIGAHMLWVRVDYKRASDDAGYVNNSLSDALKIIKAEQKLHRDEKPGDVMINVYVATTDQYGKDGMGYAYRMTFDAEQVSRVEFNQTEFLRLMNLATVDNRKPVGKSILRDWCRQYRDYAPRNCYDL